MCVKWQIYCFYPYETKFRIPWNEQAEYVAHLILYVCDTQVQFLYQIDTRSLVTILLRPSIK